MAMSTVVWELLLPQKTIQLGIRQSFQLKETSKKGGKKIESTLDTSRTFKLKVIEVSPYTTLIWGDAMGKRTFELIQTEAVFFSQ